MRPITVWLCQDTKTKVFEHNHVELGHVPEDQVFPTANSDYQRKSWKNGKWQKTLAFLDDNETIRASET